MNPLEPVTLWFNFAALALAPMSAGGRTVLSGPASALPALFAATAHASVYTSRREGNPGRIQAYTLNPESLPVKR